MHTKDDVPLEEKVQLLRKTVSVLEKNNIKYWITMGVLLGYARGKTFIKGDTDIDVGVHNTVTTMALSDEFEREGLTIDKEYENTVYINEKFKLTFSQFKKRPDGRMEFSLHMKCSILARTVDSLFHILKRNVHKPGILEGKGMKILIPFSYFIPFREQLIPLFEKMSNKLARTTIFIFKPFELIEDKFEGVTVKIPKDYEEHLLYIYGPTWSIPRTDFKNKEYNTFSKKINGIYITEVGKNPRRHVRV